MRYRAEKKGLLKNINYKHLKDKYDRESAVIYRTIDYGGLKNLNIEIASYGLWTASSSLIKISYEVYGQPDYWWVIGLVNAKPTDAHFSLGDEIYYPTSPTLIINSIGS